MPEQAVIDGVYRLVRRIGRGGMARVYLAEVDRDRFDYALLYAYTQVQGANHAERRANAERLAGKLSGKTLDPVTVRAILEAHDIPLPGERAAVKIANEEADMVRFEAEWRNLLCLNHPNVVKVYGGGAFSGRPYYAMQLLENIVDRETFKRDFGLDDKIRILIEAGRGLHYLHENGIVHRDVKPDNMVTCRAADGSYHTVVTDLGIAKDLTQKKGTTITQTFMGTPCFMAPEQVASARDVDGRADIYSLGAVLYHFTTGKQPYHEKPTVYALIHAISQGERPTDPLKINPEIPKELVSILTCAMAWERTDRYPSMDQMVADLERYLRGQQETDEGYHFLDCGAALIAETVVDLPPEARPATADPAATRDLGPALAPSVHPPAVADDDADADAGAGGGGGGEPRHTHEGMATMASALREAHPAEADHSRPPARMEATPPARPPSERRKAVEGKRDYTMHSLSQDLLHLLGEKAQQTMGTRLRKAEGAKKRELLREIVRGLRGSQGGEKAWRYVQHAYVNGSNSLRLVCLEMLPELLEKEQEADALATMVHDTDARVRAKALERLAALRANDLAPTIARSLRDPSSTVRQAAAKALRTLDLETTLEPLLLYHLRRGEGLPEALHNRILRGEGPATLKLLAGPAHSQHPEVRAYAAALLGEIHSKRAIDPLHALLRDPHPLVRASAARAAGYLRQRDLRPAILEALRDTNALVQRAAIDGLIQLGPTPAAALLLMALGKRKAAIPADAARFYGALDDDADALEAMLENPGQLDEQGRKYLYLLLTEALPHEGAREDALLDLRAAVAGERRRGINAILHGVRNAHKEYTGTWRKVGKPAEAMLNDLQSLTQSG